jgi:hypothetical protein
MRNAQDVTQLCVLLFQNRVIRHGTGSYLMLKKSAALSIETPLRKIKYEDGSTERRSRVVNNCALYSGASGFESWP